MSSPTPVASPPEALSAHPLAPRHHDMACGRLREGLNPRVRPKHREEQLQEVLAGIRRVAPEPMRSTSAFTPPGRS